MEVSSTATDGSCAASWANGAAGFEVGEVMIPGDGNSAVPEVALARDTSTTPRNTTNPATEPNTLYRLLKVALTLHCTL